MVIYNKDSLEALRLKVDLVEVLSSHIELKRTGAAYKGLCPFHDEKTPSFVVQKGDTHYHCFGCGAHGDAIQFLMNHQKLSFIQAIESLAQRFQVTLEKSDSTEPKGPNKTLLKEALETACRFYHYCLLNSAEGHEALQYLFGRGIDLEFIKQFQIGLSPKASGIFLTIMREKGIAKDILIDAGLLTMQSREFFHDRIMFPIQHHIHGVIGFSGRKYKEETFGGKYVNTPETVLFKKSRVLFGLNFCRRRIAKERKAIVVEGQIDALRLIHEGFNITVAGQGTAFGENHAKELIGLGVRTVFLALDSDKAGQEATSKIGHLFQREGVDVRVVAMPEGSDPDSFIREKGKEAFTKLLQASQDFLAFMISYYSKTNNIDTPAGKNEIVQIISKQIRQWNHPVMVHETLRKLAHALKVPEDTVGVGLEMTPNHFIRKASSIGHQAINPDRILEGDMLRWILLMGQEKPALIEMVRAQVSPDILHDPLCRKIFSIYMAYIDEQKPIDLITLILDLNEEEGQGFLSELLQKKVNRERVDLQFTETLKKILDRNWIQKREEIRMKIQGGLCSDEEALALAKQFDELKRSPPQVLL